MLLHLDLHAQIHGGGLQNKQEVPELHVHGHNRADQLVSPNGEEAGTKGGAHGCQ